MPVAQTVQSFIGISNENEFYDHHYLAEVFADDIRPLIDRWHAAEEAATDEDNSRAPDKRLGDLADTWFSALAVLNAQVGLREEAAKSPDQRSGHLQHHRQLHAPLLEALGYTLHTQAIELREGGSLPVWATYGPTYGQRQAAA